MSGESGRSGQPATPGGTEQRPHQRRRRVRHKVCKAGRTKLRLPTKPNRVPPSPVPIFRLKRAKYRADNRTPRIIFPRLRAGRKPIKSRHRESLRLTPRAMRRRPCENSEPQAASARHPARGKTPSLPPIPKQTRSRSPRPSFPPYRVSDRFVLSPLASNTRSRQCTTKLVHFNIPAAFSASAPPWSECTSGDTSNARIFAATCALTPQLALSQ